MTYCGTTDRYPVSIGEEPGGWTHAAWKETFRQGRDRDGRSLGHRRGDGTTFRPARRLGGPDRQQRFPRQDGGEGDFRRRWNGGGRPPRRAGRGAVGRSRVPGGGRL